tara:strand:+ start:172 stop:438 length:267 start_codon:yes stop_codon:yes gene_type:complete
VLWFEGDGTKRHKITPRPQCILKQGQVRIAPSLSETINLSKDDGFDKKSKWQTAILQRFVRAVRMEFEHRGSYETQSAATAAIVPKIG